MNSTGKISALKELIFDKEEERKSSEQVMTKTPMTKKETPSPEPSRIRAGSAEVEETVIS